MIKNKILLLGGAYAQIPMIKEAKRQGYYVITCDYLPDNPGHKFADEYHNVSTTDYKGVFELAQIVKPDLIIAYASDPASPVAAYVSEKLGLPGNSYKSVLTLAEKDLFRSLMKDIGLNTPRTIVLTPIQDSYEKLESLTLPFVIKPTDSSGSKGVSKVYKKGQIPGCVQKAFSFSRNKRIIAEEYIDVNGKQVHGDGFVSNGKLIFTFLGDHNYNSKVNPFVPFATTWPSIKPQNTIKKIDEIVSQVCKKAGYFNGPINIEARETTEGDIYIMEVGPRSGGNFVPQITSLVTGFDMVKATLDVFTKKPVRVNCCNATNYSAYYVIHSSLDGQLQKLQLNSGLKRYLKQFHQNISPGEKVKSFQGANAAIGIMLLTFKTREEMECIVTNMDQYIELKIK